jgi:hypothetical protein
MAKALFYTLSYLSPCWLASATTEIVLTFLRNILVLIGAGAVAH